MFSYLLDPNLYYYKYQQEYIYHMQLPKAIDYFQQKQWKLSYDHFSILNSCTITKATEDEKKQNICYGAIILGIDQKFKQLLFIPNVIYEREYTQYTIKFLNQAQEISEENRQKLLLQIDKNELKQEDLDNVIIQITNQKILQTQAQYDLQITPIENLLNNSQNTSKTINSNIKNPN